MGELREVFSEHYDAEWDIVVWELTLWDGTLGYKLDLYERDTASAVLIGEWDQIYKSVQEARGVVPFIIEYLKLM